MNEKLSRENRTIDIANFPQFYEKEKFPHENTSIHTRFIKKQIDTPITPLPRPQLMRLTSSSKKKTPLK